MKRFALALTFGAITLATISACTILVITDAQQVLFCNNEDWSNPKTKIWFVPGSTRYGCAYVGFNNGWGQGGMNTEGLAFDWVAGYKEKWEPDPKLERVKGNPAERMLESCASVQEVIVFSKRIGSPAFPTPRY